jgi:hypothetical protein
MKSILINILLFYIFFIHFVTYYNCSRKPAYNFETLPKWKIE